MSVEFKYAPRKGLGPLLIDINAVQPEERRTANEPVRIEFEQLVHSRFESYLSDESGLGPGNAQLVFFPTTEKQVADFLLRDECAQD